ncbi:NeuD/PglB/VioB family sugar acetyltransferase [Sphingobacterium sp. BIGb0165]|uniref:NeuD/PglB/VioB family sugar acetyltransferase n=1 Tax=Sphingobacterium sp. BIGb0165 TaxID=2940615 RepID=UPI00216741E2|nr:NeuD/PglB/VioB family sugar acetyltransferase [Sphingobacterium sp. BIGb0165]MCS4227924.1 sugar O-acyltransferase (sialic acid O-acetyltransferase NeuD family) [Sphingobacterium sp. BIGb0165]
MDKIAIIGYSGHSYVVLDACLKNDLYVQFYSDLSEKEENPFDLQYLGDESSENFDWSIADSYILGIGDNNIREIISSRIIANGKKILNVIHPTSTIANLVKLGNGNYIGPQSIINTCVQMGDCCIVNSGAIIEHECQIADYVHLAPGSVLAGQVIIGRKTFVGANAVVKQGVTIGDNVIIGAGSVVLNDVSTGEVWVGNPAKKIR